MSTEFNDQPKISFIGCGNMGSSLIAGLINNGYPADLLCAAEPDAEKRERLHTQLSIALYQDNNQAIENADVIVLAVKPQILLNTVQSLAAHIPDNSLLISIAAGIRCDHIAQYLNDDMAIVRAMPNTPALINLGATGLYANRHVGTHQKQLTERIINSAGISVWVADEALIDVVTAISGSGPAYYFLFMEIFERLAVDMGLDKEQANLLVQQTALGAANMAIQSDDNLRCLRENVSSPGGTTEAAIQSMLQQDIETLFKNALTDAKLRSEQLSEQFGKQS